MLAAVAETLSPPRHRSEVTLAHSDGRRRAWLFDQGVVEGEDAGRGRDAADGPLDRPPGTGVPAVVRGDTKNPGAGGAGAFGQSGQISEPVADPQRRAESGVVVEGCHWRSGPNGVCASPSQLYWSRPRSRSAHWCSAHRRTAPCARRSGRGCRRSRHCRPRNSTEPRSTAQLSFSRRARRACR